MKTTPFEKLSPQELLEMAESYGLLMDSLTGGRYFTDYASAVISKPMAGQYKLHSGSEEMPILFFEGWFFQKTVEMTEKSTKIRLFV